MNLLSPKDPPVSQLENPHGRSSVVLVCEHGGRAFPLKLGQLGLDDHQTQRHFAWDIGALDLARGLSDALDAPLIHQAYFIPEQGEEITILGNTDLSQTQRKARLNEIWRPFHDHLSALLDQREQLSLQTVLISIHSFTPVFFGRQRPLEVGVLCDRERRFAEPLYQQLENKCGRLAALNEPYDMNRESDYTIPVHGEDRGLLCAEIEVRNNLISDSDGLAFWVETLAQAISSTLDQVLDTPDMRIQN